MKLASIVLIVCALINSSHGLGYGRIVNGTNAEDGEFPFVVSIQYAEDGVHTCGGSIISPLWILTAAHCIDADSDYRVQYGSNVITPYSRNIAFVEKKFVHRFFSLLDAENDIALLKLATPIPFGPKVSAVYLPRNRQQTAGNLPATIIGWGKLKGGGLSPSKLQKAVVQTFSDIECRSLRERSRGRSWEVRESNICAGLRDGSVGPCNGDSGGPLIVDNVLVGIVSYGPITCSNVPTVFTEVSYYTKSIDFIIKNN